MGIYDAGHVDCGGDRNTARSAVIEYRRYVDCGGDRNRRFGSAGAVTVSNTGVTSIVAGTNITISGGTGAVTINSTAGGSVTWANDLSGSTSSNQWVNSISGHAGGGGTVSVGGSANTNLV